MHSLLGFYTQKKKYVIVTQEPKEKSVGTPFPGCLDCTDSSRRGDPRGRSKPHHEWWGGRPQADRPTMIAVPRVVWRTPWERCSHNDIFFLWIAFPDKICYHILRKLILWRNYI